MSPSPVAGAEAWIALLQAKEFHNYRLDRCIGRGAFGLVFEATNIQTSDHFAVKVLQPTTDPNHASEFHNEGVLLQHLNSSDGVINYIDGGVAIVDLPIAAGQSIPLEFRYHVLTMAGGSLDELIENPVARNQLSWVERLRFFRDAVKAIRQMHANGVAHRDLKSSNCLMLVRGNLTTIRLGDLGRAKDLRMPPSLPDEYYMTGRGDLRFSPPEHLYLQGGNAMGDFLAADYYGLGSLLVELATGQGLTALTLGNFRSVLQQSHAEQDTGFRRDLGGLSSRYRAVLLDVVSILPKSIQADAQIVLMNLANPIPGARLTASPFSRDRRSTEPLDWVLRRVDIMIKRLELEAHAASRTRQKIGARS